MFWLKELYLETVVMCTELFFITDITKLFFDWREVTARETARKKVKVLSDPEKRYDGKRGNPARGHPVLEDFIRKHDCSTPKTHAAFLVYLNLAEVRGWRDVNLHYCERLQTPFITGRPSLSADLEAVLPMAVDESLSHQQMRSLFSSLCTEDQKFSRVVLAICSSDTSLVYYKVSNDIVKPEPPEVSEARKQEWQQRAAKRKQCVAECIESFSRRQDHDASAV